MYSANRRDASNEQFALENEPVPVRCAADASGLTTSAPHFHLASAAIAPRRSPNSHEPPVLREVA